MPRYVNVTSSSHQIDDDGHQIDSGEIRDDLDPSNPRVKTLVDAHWLYELEEPAETVVPAVTGDDQRPAAGGTRNNKPRQGHHQGEN